MGHGLFIGALPELPEGSEPFGIAADERSAGPPLAYGRRPVGGFGRRDERFGLGAKPGAPVSERHRGERAHQPEGSHADALAGDRLRRLREESIALRRTIDALRGVAVSAPRLPTKASVERLKSIIVSARSVMRRTNALSGR